MRQAWSISDCRPARYVEAPMDVLPDCTFSTVRGSVDAKTLGSSSSVTSIAVTTTGFEGSRLSSECCEGRQ